MACFQQQPGSSSLKPTAYAAVITSTLLYLVNWEEESAKAKTLVMKADLAEAMLAVEQEEEGEDSFEDPQQQGQAPAFICL